MELVHGRLCAICRKAWATELDHRVPLHRGGADDASNLQPLCGPCHQVKTGKERRGE